jgi:hypothetical protein
MSDVLTYGSGQKRVPQIGDVVMVPVNIRAIVIGIREPIVKILGIATSIETGVTTVLQPPYVHDVPISECHYMEKQTLNL